MGRHKTYTIPVRIEELRIDTVDVQVQAENLLEAKRAAIAQVWDVPFTRSGGIIERKAEVSE